MSSKPNLNNILSDLMRYAGGGGAKNIADEDIDKYVADLILKEAGEKKKRYEEIGIQAYKPSTPKPRPNTKFLLNVMKATDSHNQIVIKSSEENIARLRKERLRKEKEQRTKKRSRRESEDEKERHKHRRKNHDKERERSKSPVKYRGRGKIRVESSMDKYFSSEYDPLLDVDDNNEQCMTANEHRKLHKKKKEKK
ncbi:hypothetical protein G6F29_001207 [Rhizopus arrhizus]|nr:hypothetical protein G6F29_001207 [Rhizopus arrhizus]